MVELIKEEEKQKLYSSDNHGVVMQAVTSFLRITIRVYFGWLAEGRAEGQVASKPGSCFDIDLADGDVAQMDIVAALISVLAI